MAQQLNFPDYTDYKTSNYNIAIDTSGSMKWAMGESNKKVRFEACQEQAVEIADLATTFDEDGIRVYTFAGQGRWTRTDHVTGDKVVDIFEQNKPRGGTYCLEILRDCFMDYLSRRGQAEQSGAQLPPGERLIIFTDGCASDKKEIALEIASFTTQLRHPQEFRISFVIVLEKDDSNDEYREVKEYVEYLDDTLMKKGAKDVNGNRIKARFDIVDCKSLKWVEKHSSKRFFKEMMID